MATRTASGTSAALRRANLLALLLPGVAFAGLWLSHAGDPRLAWLDPSRGSPHFFVIAACGAAGTVAGILDWRYHRGGGRVVGREERLTEFGALVFGGLPLFLVMAWATLADDPSKLLLPAVAIAIAVAVAVSYDEFTFHRRCARAEMWMHRVLTLGMGGAWLAWAHGCFVARLGRD